MQSSEAEYKGVKEPQLYIATLNKHNNSARTSIRRIRELLIFAVNCVIIMITGLNLISSVLMKQMWKELRVLFICVKTIFRVNIELKACFHRGAQTFHHLCLIMKADSQEKINTKLGKGAAGSSGRTQTFSLGDQCVSKTTSVMLTTMIPFLEKRITSKRR